MHTPGGFWDVLPEVTWKLFIILSSCLCNGPVSAISDLLPQLQTCPFHTLFLSPIPTISYPPSSHLPFSLDGHCSFLSFLTQAQAWLPSSSPATNITIHRLPQDFVPQFFSLDDLFPSCPRDFSRAILCPSQPFLLLSNYSSCSQTSTALCS